MRLARPSLNQVAILSADRLGLRNRKTVLGWHARSETNSNMLLDRYCVVLVGPVGAAARHEGGGVSWLSNLSQPPPQKKKHAWHFTAYGGLQ